MHTFFINTSGKEVENYSDVFEIYHETKKLVSIDCSFAEWNDKEKGYKACVHRMGALIDEYKGINNDFNLIVYVDLLSYEVYTSISENRHRDRYACLKALRSILKHYIKNTLIKEMNECGRVPLEVLVIFEENQLPTDADERSEDGKMMVRTYSKEILGLPSEGEIDKILYNNGAAYTDSLSSEQFCKELSELRCSCIGKNILYTYLAQVALFLEESKGCECCKQHLEIFLDRVVDCSREDNKSVSSVSFITGRRSGMSNKRELTHRNLKICFYILSCVEDETIFDIAASSGSESRVVKKFPDIDWSEAVKLLVAKENLFRRKHKEIQSLSESFSELNLAPELHTFNNVRFGLDEYGKRAKSFNVVDVDGDGDKGRAVKDESEGTAKLTENKAVVVEDNGCGKLFSEEEYPAFDYYGTDTDKFDPGKNATPEKYIAQAQNLRLHHLDYLRRLKSHVSERLSNYAGRSAENEPALLGKRRVNVSEESFDDTEADYRYAVNGHSGKPIKLKTAEEFSKTAYASALLDYMEFCAGRSVALTDIEGQCNWFVTRVHQITESLKRMKQVAISLFFAIIAIYLPFVILQWGSITKNSATVAVALASVLLPMAVIYVIFIIVSRVQRRKYAEAWDKFKDRSRRILKENAIAAENFDRLLSVYIPSLRWVYEYKLDVEFYADCCKMARAKIGHHLQKLDEGIAKIRNIIEDLEPDNSEITLSEEKQNKNKGIADEIDYNVSFCTGNKNRRFYSVIDRPFLTSVSK